MTQEQLKNIYDTLRGVSFRYKGRLMIVMYDMDKKEYDMIPKYVDKSA